MNHINKDTVNLKESFEFNPYLFLMSLGAGGIVSSLFAFLNYTIPHGSGLIDITKMPPFTSIGENIFFISIYVLMIAFTVLHIILTGILSSKWIKWFGTTHHDKIKQDTTQSISTLVPFVSLLMTMNVFIGAIRFFVPFFANNLQNMMLPALIVWGIIWILLIQKEIELLTSAFEKGFDIKLIGFNWLMYVMALAMLTVTGTGIAALAKDPIIAHISAFLSIISLSMGIFLFMIFSAIIFFVQFTKEGLPEKQIMPSTLVIIPIVTLFSISLFRLGHYMERQLSIHLGSYFVIVTLVAFAFEIWYAMFGLNIMKHFLKSSFKEKEFLISQWGMVCPIVAIGVLGSFVYSTWFANPVLYIFIITSAMLSIVVYGIIFIRHLKSLNYN